jgi:hypothetical protein
MVGVCSFHGRMADCSRLHKTLTGERRGAMGRVRVNAETPDPPSSDEVRPESLDGASPSRVLRAPGQEADRPAYNDWDEV